MLNRRLPLVRSLVALACALSATLAASRSPAQTKRRLSLEEAISLARARRSEVTDAETQVSLADLQLLRAGLSRFQLTLDSRLSEQVQRLYVNAPPALCASLAARCNETDTARSVAVSAGLTIPLWSGLKLEAQWTHARLMQRAARAQKRSTFRKIDVEVAVAYWGVRKQELLRDLAADDFKRRATLAAVTRARVDAGIAHATDYKRAQAALLRARIALDDHEALIEQAKAELGLMLQTDEDFVLTTDPPTEQPPLPPLDLLLARAQRTRPEIEAAGAQLEAQEQRVRAAKGDWWPQVSAFGRADAGNEVFGVQQRDLVRNFMAGFVVSWLVFDNLTTYQAVREATLERQRLEHDRLRVRSSVVAELRTSYSRTRRALENRQPLELAVATSRTTLDLVRRQYEAGLALMIEVLAAEEELQQLESAVVENTIELMQARAALDAESGGVP